MESNLILNVEKVIEIDYCYIFNGETWNWNQLLLQSKLPCTGCDEAALKGWGTI